MTGSVAEGTNIPWPEFEPHKMYACCVAPFAAVRIDAGAAPGEDVGTVTVRIPGRGRLTLPSWFAEEYVTSIAVPAEGTSHFTAPGLGQTRIMVPQESVDEHRPVFVTQPRSIAGWDAVAAFGSQNAPGPPALVGTASERQVAVNASASAILDECSAVPHEVVPRLVTQHIVGLFTAKLKCTVDQTCLGATSLDVEPGFPFHTVPNVTRLKVTDIPSSPLPPKTSTLVVAHDPMSVRQRAPAQHNMLQNSVCGLTTLEFHRCRLDVAQFGTTPIPTLRRLVLSTLQHPAGENSAAAVKQVSILTPNVTSLTFDDGAQSWDAIVPCFDAGRGSVWPHADSLDFAGSPSSVAAMASARPWQVLVLRLTSVPTTLPELTRRPSNLSDSLVLGLHLPHSAAHDEQSLYLLTSFCPNFVPQRLQSLTMPTLSMMIPLESSEATFFSQARSLEDMCVMYVVEDADRPSYVKPSPDAIATAFNHAFPPSLISVGMCGSDVQYVRSETDKAQWRSQPLPRSARKHIDWYVAPRDRPVPTPQVMLVESTSV